MGIGDVKKEEEEEEEEGGEEEEEEAPGREFIMVRWGG